VGYWPDHLVGLLVVGLLPTQAQSLMLIYCNDGDGVRASMNKWEVSNESRHVTAHGNFQKKTPQFQSFVGQQQASGVCKGRRGEGMRGATNGLPRS
jgi:hypothetical protein